MVAFPFRFAVNNYRNEIYELDKRASKKDEVDTANSCSCERRFSSVYFSVSERITK